MAIKEQFETLMQQHPDEMAVVLTELGYVQTGNKVIMSPEDMDKMAAENSSVARSQALDYATQIIDACMLAARPGLAKTLIAEEVSLEDAGARLQAEKAKDADKNAIRSTVGAVTTGEVNPLIADARKRADTAAAPRAK
jgi:hypothetical protein